MRFLLTLILVIGLTRCNYDSLVNPEPAPPLADNTTTKPLEEPQSPTNASPSPRGKYDPSEQQKSTVADGAAEHQRYAASGGSAPVLEAGAGGLVTDPLPLQSGDRVVTNKEADLFDRPGGTVIDQLAAGTRGTIFDNTTEWARVDFDTGASGVVRTEDLDPFVEGPPPPEEPPPFIVEAAGFVGCSNTHEKRRGAGLLSDTWDAKFWPEEITRDIGHGSLGEWGDPASVHYEKLWGVIERGFAAMPGTNAIVWEVCIGRRDRQPDEPTPNELELRWAEAVLSRLQTEHPGVTLFVSGLNTYDGFDCKLTGMNGPEKAQAVADHVIGLGASPGVSWGPLSGADVEADMCHLSEQGEAFTGGQLINFFESLESG